MSETYDNKAINGKELAEQTLVGVASEIKREGYVSAAAFNDVVARLVALEKAMAEQNLGERTADSLDAQSLKVGGTDVKTKHAAKSNPSVSSGSANTFVDTISQDENGEMTATRRVMKMYTGTGSNTDAPMTQMATSDAIALKSNIASPTFTGTPTAPTASGATDTTQIATTAFVHDAIEEDLKKASDVSGMGNDDTHAYSGEAVSMAISAAVSGEVGGFLGNKTVAQMNAYTNPKMGDNAIVTDTGTITVGSTSCAISTAPSEVRWTTSGSWQVTSVGYVRDTQKATTSALGLVKTNNADGGVSLNSGDRMVVNGWGDKANKNGDYRNDGLQAYYASRAAQAETSFEVQNHSSNINIDINATDGVKVGQDNNPLVTKMTSYGFESKKSGTNVAVTTVNADAVTVALGSSSTSMTANGFVGNLTGDVTGNAGSASTLSAPAQGGDLRPVYFNSSGTMTICAGRFVYSCDSSGNSITTQYRVCVGSVCSANNSISIV